MKTEYTLGVWWANDRQLWGWAVWSDREVGEGLAPWKWLAKRRATNALLNHLYQIKYDEEKSKGNETWTVKV